MKPIGTSSHNVRIRQRINELLTFRPTWLYEEMLDAICKDNRLLMSRRRLSGVLRYMNVKLVYEGREGHRIIVEVSKT